jgi:hypothetical protein
VSRNSGEVTTMIGALDVRGMRAMMTVEGGTDANVFEAFVEQVLIPKLHAGDIVVLDNVGTHKAQPSLGAHRSSGCAPPVPAALLSPDLNPIGGPPGAGGTLLSAKVVVVRPTARARRRSRGTSEPIWGNN